MPNLNLNLPFNAVVNPDLSKVKGHAPHTWRKVGNQVLPPGKSVGSIFRGHGSKLLPVATFILGLLCSILLKLR